jgi:hypothetical protein
MVGNVSIATVGEKKTRKNAKDSHHSVKLVHKLALVKRVIPRLCVSDTVKGELTAF